MKKILFLSSAFIMTTLGAYAADGIITGGAGTCTVDVLGVSDNNATANTIATWSLNDYECGAGQYLDEDTLTCTTCPAGSYCPGGTFTIENASSGTFDCPAGYTESAAGAGTNNECYTACTVANANIEHATAVSGNNYYGTTDADTCTATDCELGYHVESEIELVEKTPLIPVDYKTAGNDHEYIAQGGTADSDDTAVGLSAQNTYAVDYDYGRVYGRASCQPSADPASVYFFSNLEAVASGTMSMEEFHTGALAITSKAKANVIVDFAKAYLMAMTGQGDMTEAEIEEAFTKYFVTFSESPDKNYTTDSTGQYCYCQMDGFAPITDGVLGEKTSVTSAPWVFKSGDGSADNCASLCADNCAYNLYNDAVNGRAVRAAVFGAFDAVEVGGMCKITENNCPAGQYLAVVGDAMMCVPCKSGSYCPGGVYTIESENKGTNACPAGYANSDEGASADTQCYTDCKVSDFEHATAVTGNDYYGTGTDTCGATDCVFGYHVDYEFEIVEQEPLIVTEGDINGGVLINGNGEKVIEDVSGITLTENNTGAVQFDNGIVYFRASCQPAENSTFGYLVENGEAVESGDMSMDELRAGLTEVSGPAKANLIVKLAGMDDSDLTEEEAEELEALALLAIYTENNVDYSTSSTGQWCYVRADAFQPNGGTKTDVVGTPWVLLLKLFETADECAANCIADGVGFALSDFLPITLGAIALSGGDGGMCVITESNCPAGTYYRKTSTTLECVPCPAGSFCPGGLFTIDSTTNGENACPAGYPKSDVGAGADTQCYKNCEVSDIPHATAVAGNDYYGAGVDTCVPTKCQTGYHKIADLTASEAGAVTSIMLGEAATPDTVNNVRNNWDELYSDLSEDEQNQIATIINSMRYVEPEPSVPLEPFVVLWDRMMANYDAEAGTRPYAPAAGYSYIRNVDGTEKCQAVSGVSNLFFSVAGAGGVDISCDVAAAENADVAEFRATAQNGDWFLTMPNKNIEVSGKSKCDYSVTGIESPCRATYTSVNGRAVTENWVAGSDMSIDAWPEGSGQCETLCTSKEVPFWVIIEDVTGCAAKFAGYDMGGLNVDCSNLTALNTGLYQGMAQTMDISDELVVGGTCGANLINIDWNPDNGGAHTQNMCYYDGEITLPDEPVKVGYTFSGWKLME